MRASAQSTNSPFIQIFSVACTAKRILSGGVAGHVRGFGAAQPDELRRRERGQMPMGAGTDPQAVVAQQPWVDEHEVDLRERERRDGSRLESGYLEHALGPRDLAALRSNGGRDLARVSAAIARDE